jgi:hypothetical protein
MRILSALLVLVPLLVSQITTLTPAEAASCQFVLGFKTLHDLLPNVVGDCRVDEHYNPVNGDGLQETTRGLLVWRKADNWTAFTDGYRSWINGPNGLQERLNSQRFAWELRPCQTQTFPETFSWSPGPNGAAIGHGTVTNPCSDPYVIMLDVVATASPGGQPLEDAPTVFVTVPAGGTASVTDTVPLAAQAPNFDRFTAGYDAADPRPACFPVDPSHCLPIDARLLTTASTLQGLDEGKWLLSVAAQNGIQVMVGPTPPGVGGYFEPATKHILLDESLLASSAWVRADVLAHELQHAADNAAGIIPVTSAGCVDEEQRAFTRQAQVWNDLWKGHLPPALDQLHDFFNLVANAVANDPVALHQAIARTYQTECATGG